MTSLLRTGLCAVALLTLEAAAWAVDPRIGGADAPELGPSGALSSGRSRSAFIDPGAGNGAGPSTGRLTIPSASQFGFPSTAAPGLNVLPISTTRPDVAGAPVVRQNRWRLGVYSKDTDSGVRIVQVVNGSAASRAGLEPNDVIVTVSGYQVGYVNGELFDCATEFERWASADGWVNLLVQNNRNGQLVVMPLQLDSRLQRLTGAITFNDRVTPLPQDAVASIELQEIVRPGAPPITLARQTVDRPRQYPVPFEIEFDPLQIDTRRTYTLRASISSNRRTIYASRNSVQVLTPNQPSRITLALDRVQNAVIDPVNPYAQDIGMEQVVALYQQYLNRDPSPQEILAWQSQLQRGADLLSVQSDLLGHNQFFNQCDRDEQVYIERLHELMLSRKPNAEELAYWLNRYNETNGIRRDIAKEFLTQIDQLN